jgi:uncharacterized membrane protein
MHAHSGQLDISARAGLLLGAAAIGSSYQRGLLSRGTSDQALITGVAAASAYGWGSAMHSALRSVGDRLAGSDASSGRRRATGLALDTLTALAGAAVVRALPPAEHEAPARALARLAAGGKAAAAGAGLLAGLAAGGPVDSSAARRAARDLGTAAAVGAAAYALTRPSAQVAGADTTDETSTQDTVHDVEPAKAAALGAGMTLVLLGLAHGESRLVSALSTTAARVLGGQPADHRAVGRLGALGLTAGVGWLGLSAVVTKLQSAGQEMEAAHSSAPEIPEVTGSPESHIDWSVQSREGRRWLSMALQPDHIASVMGAPAKQPIRIYASLESASTPQERAELLLREVDRTRALERSVFALFCPTGSGYVNYVADETLEYLTLGDCASAAIEYSVLPSALSLTRVHMGTQQTRMVVDGIVERLMAMDPDQRPRFVLFGESLGSQVSQEMFRGTGMSGPTGACLDAAVWIGTPAATVWRDEIWGSRSMADPPGVGPGAALITRCISDWKSLSDEDRAQVHYLLLQNGDDPIPKFGAPLLWQCPGWLGADDRRPPGAPRGTRWIPVTTFFTTFVDMINALTPTPGIFAEGGHDYRVEVPEALRAVWQLGGTDDQFARVQNALRERELGWEAYRRWTAAEATPDAGRAAAEDAVVAEVGQWTGTGAAADKATVEQVISKDTQPT